MIKSPIIRRTLLFNALAIVALGSGSYLQGFVVTGYKWSTNTVPYFVNPRNNDVSEGAAVSAIQTGAAGWHEQSQANIELVYAGSTSGSSLTMNNKNEVFFRSESGCCIAETYWWWDGSGRLVDADVVIYDGGYQFYAGSGCSGGIYIEDVMIHEFGHALGLNHSPVSGVTMSPSMPSYCDRTQLTLELDDIAGIESLYPPLSGPNTAPQVTVNTPLNNSSYADGSMITFSGSATDLQDGNLTASLRWTSNLSGQIGTGGTFSQTLSAGTHQLTVAVTDSGGLSGSIVVTTTVTVSVPTGPTLAVRGYKVKGLQKADLTWSGLASASIEVLRNGTRIATTANDGAMTDAIDKKGAGSYTYKVCEAGTSVCSNQATITF